MQTMSPGPDDRTAKNHTNVLEELPTTLNTPTFAGFVITQFLGAFNDNYFKQLVLLTCVTEIASTGKDWQPIATAAFALPFVLLSGFAGYLSDRFSKQRTIVLCKVGEIVIMCAALGVLLIPDLQTSTQLMLLIGVLALMGGQSALFGPSKYGSLPELFRSDQLLRVNGVVQMTTFLAIIFGVACAGIALDHLGRSLWAGGLIAVGIAIAGTLTSLWIRRTFAANPGLPLQAENLAVPVAVRSLLRQRPALLHAMLVAAVFWFVGGVAQPAVNTLGVVSLQLSETRASLLTAAIGIGIATGCGLVGSLATRSGGRWVMRGAWGMILVLFCISLLGSRAKPASTSIPDGRLNHNPQLNVDPKLKADPPSLEVADNLGSGSTGVDTTRPDGQSAAATMPESQSKTWTAPEPLWKAIVSARPLEWMLRLCMMFLGVFAGIFVVPLQVYLQQSPPPEQKGRVLGVQNLFSWIGILLSAAFLALFNFVLAATVPSDQLAAEQHHIFTLMAVMLLPIAFCYRLPQTEVQTV